MIRNLRSVFLAAFGWLALVASSSAQDASELIVRLGRLEGQIRQMSGQVEQLQFENRQLKDQFRKFQEDVEFRFQEKGGRGAAPAQPPAQGGAKPARRSDAFDPTTDPAAPGTPRQLGAGPTTSPSPPPGRRDPIAGIIEEDESDAAPPSRRPLDLGAAAGRSASSEAPRAAPVERGTASVDGMNPGRAPSVASTATGDARTDYDVAYAFLMQRQYDRAEMSFRSYLQSHPRDRLVPDATFWLGDTYLQRSRPREAAEQFLKVSTDYSRSAKAPDALLKLGVSLAALGAKDQACATFAELERKFPTASASIKQGVDREQKRARCAA